MSTTQALSAVRPQALLVSRAVFALALTGFAGTLSAQYDPDADTAALYHFDVQTPEGTTPDSGPNGLDGVLEGAVLPTHVEATVGGYGFAYKFDGVDRGANNSRINMGTDARLALRGTGDWSLDVLVTVTTPLADDGYFRGIICRASSAGIDYSLLYSSWTNPSFGPEHEFWFTTGLISGVSPDYAFAATISEGLMEVGSSYAIRVTLSAGEMTITVNGVEGTTSGPLIPGLPALPIAADLTVGDSCTEDSVTLPSELQIDELRISSVARTDPQQLGALGVSSIEVPLDLGLGTDLSAYRAWRAERSAPVAAPTPVTVPRIPTGLRIR